MRKSTLAIFIVLVLVISIFVFFTHKYKTYNVPSTSRVDLQGENLPFVLPSGFVMSLFAQGVEDARVIALDPVGVMLISQPSEGKISALPDKNFDMKADEIIVVADKLNVPHGMAFRCRDVSKPTICEFYVAEKNAVSVFDYDPELHKATNKKKLIDLPGGSVGEHFTRTLLFLPFPNEDTLLISVGSSCNVCSEKDPRRASIISYDTKTRDSKEFANGLRNSVFMTLHPVTGEVWATEMGRDGLGDDIPPDEINIIKEGGWYGWPWFYGKNIEDMKFSPNARPSFAKEPVPSHIDLQAHSAPLGLAFIPEEGWPEEYWFNLLVAYHGSWNRSVPTGYKIVRMKLDAQGKYVSTEDFITGWLTPDGKKIGRPVDMQVFPGGTIYISDDLAGVIYKVVKR